MKTIQFSCAACGAGLQVEDTQLGTHVACGFCGHDNILPRELLLHREQLADLARQAEERAERHAADRRQQRSTALRVGSVLFLVLVVLPALSYAYSRHQEQAREARFAARRQDPAFNGQEWVGERLRALQQQGCSTLLPLAVADDAEATASTQVGGFGGCVHLVAGTGFGSSIIVSNHSTASTQEVGSTVASFVDNRYCPMSAGTLSFGLVGASETAFAYALLECPRSHEETGSRSSLADPATTGVSRLRVLTARLEAAGCTALDAPSVHQGGTTLSVQSDAGAPCVHLAAASGFADVELRPEILSPGQATLPVPPARAIVQAMYCPDVSGSYPMTIWPSTRDHFTTQLFSCARAGREGLERYREIKAAAH